jgi:non-heme chloroperoxidase
VANNRAEFYRDITLPSYGYNRPGAKISEGIRQHWWLQGMMGGIKAYYDCVKAFSETDFTEDLKKATLKVYPGFPHGMAATNTEQINADLLTFFQGTAAGASS